MNCQNSKIENLRWVFEHMQDHGSILKISSDITSASHIQGIAGYRFPIDYILLSHDNSSRGYIYVVKARGTDHRVLYRFEPLYVGFNHPGGIQIIGDVLVVPIEGKDKSIICFYDLSTMDDTTSPRLLDDKIVRDRKCGGVGITNFKQEGKEKYLLATYDNGDIDFYTTEKCPSFRLPPVGSDKCKESHYSEICLVTDTNEKVYLIGFRTKGINLEDEAPAAADTYDDYMDLYTIDTASFKISEKISSRHMYCQGAKGLNGVHFRYAGGLSTWQSANLFVLASERNLKNEFVLNRF